MIVQRLFERAVPVAAPFIALGIFLGGASGAIAACTWKSAQARRCR